MSNGTGLSRDEDYTPERREGENTPVWERGQDALGRRTQQKREELRQRGISQYGDLVGAFESAEQRAQQMIPERERLARSAISGASAQAFGGLGGLRGGGAAGVMGQAGLMGGQEAIRQRMAGEKLLTERSIGHRQAALEATAAEREMGFQEQEEQDAYSAALLAVSQGITDNSGPVFTDEDAIQAIVEAQYAQLLAISPQAAARFRAQYPANRGSSGRWGY